MWSDVEGEKSFFGGERAEASNFARIYEVFSQILEDLQDTKR
jgi:hypothetical protein